MIETLIGASNIRRKRIAVTLVLLSFVSISAYALFATNLLVPRYELRMLMADANGLQPGTPVVMDGLELGRVKTVRFGPRLSVERGG